MTTSAPSDSAAGGGAPIRPRLTAEQALTRLLELIRTSRFAGEFTPDRMRRIFGVKFVTYRPGYHAFGEQVTPDWWYSIEVEDRDQTGSVLTLRFTPEDTRNADYVPMTGICQLDFDRFSSELEAMGFSKEPYYDSPPQPSYNPDTGTYDESPRYGRLMKYTFDRMRDGLLEMRIDVYPEGERVWNERTGSGRACIRMVRIF